MEVRDAVEADAAALAGIADAPADVMRNLIHDRTVRVIEDESTAADPNEDSTEDEESPELLGFVSFDARESTVHITQLDGTADACEKLLGEPIRFAARENMTVELLIPEHQTDVAAAADRVGFEEVGHGPSFEGSRTTRYRYDP